MDWIKKNRIYMLLMIVLLLAASALLRYYSDNYDPFPSVFNKLESQITEAENEFNRWVTSNIAKKIYEDSFNFEDFEKLDESSFTILIFNSKNLIFWTDNQSELSLAELNDYEKGTHFSKLKNGYHMICKTAYRSTAYGNIDIVGLFLLRNNFGDDTNKYLSEAKNTSLNIPNSVSFSTKARLDSKMLQGVSSSLYVFNDKNQNWDWPKVLIFIFIWLAILIGLILMYSYSMDLVHENKFGHGFLLYVSSLFCLRLVLYIFHLPPFIRTIELFQLQDTGLYFGSLGDLLITVIFCGFAVYFFTKNDPVKYDLTITENKKEWLFAGLLGIVLMGSWILGCIIRNVVFFSEASYKMEHLFQIKTILSLSIVFCGIYAWFLMIKYLVLLAGRLNISWEDRLKIAFLSIIAFSLLTIGLEWNIVTFFVIAMVISFSFWLESFYDALTKKVTVRYILFWIFFFSVMASVLINVTSYEREKRRRLELAQALVLQENLTAEKLMSDLSLEIMSDKVIKAYFRYPYLPQTELYKRIRTKYFGEYFSKYDVKIYAFENDGKSFRGKDKINKDYFDNKIDRLGIKTKNAYVFSLNNPLGAYSYVAKLKIFNPESPGNSGYIIIEISENESEKTVFPELVIPDKFKAPDYQEEYDYAIYSDQWIETVVGTYPYPEKRRKGYFTRQKYRFKNFNGFNHLVFNLTDGKIGDDYYEKNSELKTVIISLQKKKFLEHFTMFSYLFILLIFGVILYYAIVAFLINPTVKLRMRELLFSSLKKRINSMLVIIVCISLLMIGLITIIYFTNTSSENQKVQLKRIQKSVLSAVEYELGLFEEDSPSQQQLDRLIEDISDIHNIDVSLFDTNGKLVSSSLPLIYEKGVISKRISAEAYNGLTRDFQRSIVNTEQIGSLEYLSAYSAVKDRDGETIGFVNVPYFSKDKNVQSEISNFLIVLFNVYLIILMLAVAAGVFLSNSVTRSLDLIGEKIRQIRLGGKNERLDWPDDDEIGALVRQYNNAIDELDKSVEMLAQAEREYAWQEMAKQVAHEIKNPLTPMKLSIQHLQRAQREGHPMLGELTVKVTNTLIEQIEHLTKIANEFSSFAQMPKPQEEYVELREMLSNMLSLYEENGDKMKIVKSFTAEDCYVFVDRTQLNRVFLNIIKNALEAMEDKEQAVLITSIKIEGETVVLSFADNGKGIPEDRREKVFVPSFTSKGGGMGLGLAISRNIIENTGGKIWFETELDKGTTFFIELPLRRI